MQGFQRPAELQTLQWPTLKVRTLHGFLTHSPVTVPGIYATVQVPVHPSPGSQNTQQVCSNLITMMIKYHVCPPAHEQKSLPGQNRENTKQTDQTCPMVFF